MLQANYANSAKMADQTLGIRDSFESENWPKADSARKTFGVGFRIEGVSQCESLGI
jgi:hypothetical protein